MVSRALRESPARRGGRGERESSRKLAEAIVVGASAGVIARPVSSQGLEVEGKRSLLLLVTWLEKGELVRWDGMR